MLLVSFQKWIHGIKRTNRDDLSDFPLVNVTTLLNHEKYALNIFIWCNFHKNIHATQLHVNRP